MAVCSQLTGTLVPDGDVDTLGEGGTDGVADDDVVTVGVVYRDTVGDRDTGTDGLAVGVALRTDVAQSDHPQATTMRL